MHEIEQKRLDCIKLEMEKGKKTKGYVSAEAIEKSKQDAKWVSSKVTIN